MDLTTLCAHCALRSESLRLQHFEVLGCEPIAGRAGSCLLRFRDPLLGAGGGTPTPAPLLFAGKARPLSAPTFDATCAALDVPAEAMWSVIKVETSGCGFLPDRRPKILLQRLGSRLGWE